jgi:hypothetical protein
MKLNHDCVRDLLLVIEEEATLNTVLNQDSLLSHDRLKTYSEDDFYYSFLKVKEAGFINGDARILHDFRTVVVKSLTYEGHLFLDNIRDNTAWEGAKKKAGKSLASISLSLMSELSNAYVKSVLGLS